MKDTMILIPLSSKLYIVFFYEEDKDMNAHSFDYMSTYKTSIEGKIGRNDKCVCGSGKKYKNCCISKYEKAA